MIIALREAVISVARNSLAEAVVKGRVCGCHGGEAVDVAVVETKECGDQYRVVDLLIGGPFGFSRGDHFGGDVLAAGLNCGGDGKQGSELFAYRGEAEVSLDCLRRLGFAEEDV